MPTIISHIAVPLAIGLGLGKQKISEHLLCAGVVASVIPDADVIGFKFGIDYASQFGHRGFTHSICFALFLGLLATLSYKKLDCSRLSAFLFVSFCAASHALLDALTDGGLGVALFWPYDNARFFFPWTGIEVSAIGRGFFSMRSLSVLASEFRWIWCPAIVLSGILYFLNRDREKTT
ncbi:MAG: metal-dependent hydrolase [Arenimonas sp.]